MSGKARHASREPDELDDLDDELPFIRNLGNSLIDSLDTGVEDATRLFGAQRLSGAGSNERQDCRDLIAVVARHAGKKEDIVAQKAHAVLSAVTQYLRESGTSATTTAYLACVLNALAVSAKADLANDEEARTQTAAELKILSMLLPRVAMPVLRHSFAQASVVDRAMKAGSAPIIIKPGISVLCYFLLAQDTSAWRDVSTIRLLQTILALCVDPRPRVRKRAHTAVASLFADPFITAQIRASAATTTTKFAVRVLKHFAVDNVNPTLYLLAALKPIISYFPGNRLPQVLDALLAIDLSVSPHAYRALLLVLDALFQHSVDQGDASPARLLSPEHLDVLLQQLIDAQPPRNDEALSVLYMRLLANAYHTMFHVRWQQCSSRLPAMVRYLLGAFAFTKESVTRCAASSLSLLMTSCISADDVDALVSHPDAANNLPLGQVINQLRAALGPRFLQNWDMILTVYSALFKRLGTHAADLCADMISSMYELNKTDNFHYADALHAAFGALVVAMGPAAFLKRFPMAVVTADGQVSLQYSSNVWLLPQLREHVSHTTLACFMDQLVPIAQQLQQAVAQLSDSREHAVIVKNMQLVISQVWACFPSFARLPSDTQRVFPRLAPILGERLQASDAFRGPICRALAVLITGYQDVISFAERLAAAADSETPPSLPDPQAGALRPVGVETSRAALATVASTARNFLPLLFNLYCETAVASAAAGGGSSIAPNDPVRDAIQAFVSIADVKLLNKLFRTVMQQLLQSTIATADSDATTVAVTMAQRQALTQLSLLFVERLDAESLSFLVRVAAPQLSDPDATLQKRSYTVLATVLSKQPTWVSGNLDSVLDALQGSGNRCEASARGSRLKCINVLLPLLSPQQHEFLQALLPEVIMDVKLNNTAVRSDAFETLVAIGERYWAEGAEALENYFHYVAAGLAAQTPHAQSAAINALSRLLFQWSRNVSQELVVSVIDAVIMFLHKRSREIVKSCLGFIKVCLAVVPVDALAQRLEQIISGLLVWAHETKERFKNKVRNIIERLIRKIGLEPVMAATPEEHQNLVRYIVKEKEKAKRRKAKLEASRAETTRHRGAGVEAWVRDDQDDEEGEDEEAENDNPPAGSTAMDTEGDGKDEFGGLSRREHAAVAMDPVDFLDARGVQHGISLTNPKRLLGHEDDDDEDDDDDALFATADDGRFIIDEQDAGAGSDGDQEGVVGTKRMRKRSRDLVDSDDEAVTRDGDTYYHAGANAASQLDVMALDKDERRREKRQRIAEIRKHKAAQAQNAMSGQQFKGRGQGDVRRPGQLEPFAYVPLNRQQLNRRNKRKAAPYSDLVSKAARKGSHATANSAGQRGSGRRKRGRD